jgi:hypothetical protein
LNVLHDHALSALKDPGPPSPRCVIFAAKRRRYRLAGLIIRLITERPSSTTIRRLENRLKVVLPDFNAECPRDHPAAPVGAL